MLNVFESQLTVRRTFEAERQKSTRGRFRPLATIDKWFERHRARATVDALDPAVLADVGLRRVGDIVVIADSPDCANDDCADIFTQNRAA